MKVLEFDVADGFVRHKHFLNILNSEVTVNEHIRKITLLKVFHEKKNERTNQKHYLLVLNISSKVIISSRTWLLYRILINFSLLLKKDDYVVQYQRFSPSNCNTCFNCSSNDRWHGVGPRNCPALIPFPITQFRPGRCCQRVSLASSIRAQCTFFSLPENAPCIDSCQCGLQLHCFQPIDNSTVCLYC